MNDMEMVRYREAFVLMDETKCGMITPRDVHFLIRALGFTPTEADLARIDAEWIDQRQVDYLWFVELMSKISCTKYTYEQIEHAFVAFDRHRYGTNRVLLDASFDRDRLPRSDQSGGVQDDDDDDGRTVD